MATVCNLQDKSGQYKSLIDSIFTEDAKAFLHRLVTRFNKDAIDLLERRQKTKTEYSLSGRLPSFLASAARGDAGWRVAPVPPRLRQRHLDVGDVSPGDGDKLRAALRADVDGVQVDFDDGHCPSWPNQLRGWHNVNNFVSGGMKGLFAQEIEDRLSEHIFTQTLSWLRQICWTQQRYSGSPSPLSCCPTFTFNI